MHPLLEKLTIAIPVYNDEKYIGATIASCLPQAAHIAVYDNCSTDNTSKICAELAAQNPHLVHIRHNENIGAFENFKKSLFDCKTEYFSWVGSHDLLGENYTLSVLQEMDRDPAIALGVGLIIHIDENGNKTGDETHNKWANKSKDASPLIRVGECVTGLRRDCTAFYGIYRTALARQAWFNTPCLGFDRAMLARTAAVGKIIYEPKGVFYARNLDRSRDAKTDKDRRSKVVVREQEAPLAKNVFTRNMTMIQTVLSQANTPEELTLALCYVDKINRRYQNRRFFQKVRLAKIAGGLLLAGLLLWAFLR